VQPTGVELAGLSKVSGTVGFDYLRSMGRGDFSIHLDTSYRDRYNSDTSASRYTWIESFSVTNMAVGYRFAKGWAVDVFARNVFDEEYVTALTIQTGNSGLILGQAGEPRTVGVTFRYASN
jgi:iron complex outermembrane receptor protein